MNTEYVQYVYHFKYPVNSIDVRTIQKWELDWVLLKYEEADGFWNSRVCKDLIYAHFPEYKI